MLWLGLVGQSAVLTAVLAQDDYLPLNVGNRWVYESSEGTSTAPALETWEIVSQEATVFVVRVTQPYVTSGKDEDLFALTPEGISHVVRERGGPPVDLHQAPLILKLPPTAGASWKNDAGRYAITDTDETVTVPAGTFVGCAEVTYWTADGKVTVVTLYAPGVGMVQREERFPILGGIGGFDAPAQGRTVLRLKEWILQSSEFGVQSSESKND
jgi:hypothetical protein